MSSLVIRTDDYFLTMRLVKPALSVSLYSQVELLSLHPSQMLSFFSFSSSLTHQSPEKNLQHNKSVMRKPAFSICR